MERSPEFRSERNRQRESLASPEALREYLRNPENRAEIIAFWEYIQFLESLVSRLPQAERDETRRSIHYDLTGIIRPTTTDQPATPQRPQNTRPSGTDASGTIIASPTPPRRFRRLRLGRHMDVTLGHKAEDCWPDDSRQSLTLKDGFTVTPQNSIGIIDYYQDIPRLNADGNLIEFSRGLITAAEVSLHELAQSYSGLKAEAETFSGISHLARLAHRFGFTVFDIADEDRRARATHTSFKIAKGLAQSNEKWEKLREKYKPAKIAIISGSELVNRFGQ